MLDSQWFIVAVADGKSIVDNASIPATHLKIAIDDPAGSVLILFGPSVLVEEDEETFALAVGDTRALRNLSGFRSSGPERHAALCVVNKKTHAVRVITDRINFSKIFHYTGTGDGFALATHVTLFNKPKLALSMTGVACGIANGTQLNNSTLFRDVHVLERASVHDFRDSHRTAATYWQYGFDSVGSAGAAKQKLKDCLVDAVRDQVCDRPVLLSLSGGFDSSGILGILNKFVKPRALKTFSYVFGDPRKGSDALVAQQMAALTGYPHALLQAYDGDLVTTIRRNAQLGQGMSNFCDEIDAWHHQGQAEAGSVVLAGDESFGWSDRRMVSASDVLISVGMRKFDFAATLFPYLDPAIRQEMSDGLAAEVDSILAATSQKDLHDMKDFLYLDQRLSWMLLPWRRFIIGEYFEVREPLLQTAVLEVVKTLPVTDRIGKALYRKAIQELVPEVFSIPRARTGQAAPTWSKEILQDQEKIKKLLQAPSALDSLVHSEAIVSLLDSMNKGVEERPDWKMVVRRIVGPAAAKALRSFVRPETPRFQSAQTILMRLLVLREFLKGQSNR